MNDKRYLKSRIWIKLGSWLTGMLVFKCLPAIAQEQIDFRKDIQPILANHCLACHGFDNETRQAGLRLDIRQDAIDSAAIIPGEPDESYLIERIFSEDESDIMPPPEFHKPLSDDDKAKLRRWIEEGAEYADHWAFEPIQRPEVPTADQTGWARSPIDHFIYDRLKSEGLSPAENLPAELLFRRLCFDLTGLPPKPEDLAKFVADYQQDSETAMSDWIDRLQQTPAWAEHQARYWLDAARYADTHGLHFDNYREMWAYRDWVIRAFLQNQPFDQFVKEQVAGDLLPNPSVDQLIATGFQRCNMTTNEGGTIVEENLALYAADRVQTFSWVFMGLTTNCAQCHDHKFDPISTKDFYAMAAFFRNTDIPGLDGNNKEGNFEILRLPSPADQARMDDLEIHIQNLEKEQSAMVENGFGDFFEAFSAGQFAVDAEEQLAGIAKDLVIHLPLNEGHADTTIANQADQQELAKELRHSLWTETGKLGPAAKFDKNNTLSLGEVGHWDFDQSFTISAWIKSDKRQPNGAIIARMDEDQGFRGWDVMQFNDRLGVHLIDKWPDNAIKVQTSAAVLTSGKWHHFVVTYDGTGTPSGINIFIDGVSQPLDVLTHSLKPEASLLASTETKIGQRSKGSLWDQGQLQDLRIYQRSLTQEEIPSLWWIGEYSGFQLSTAGKEKQNEDLKSLHRKWLQVFDPDYPVFLSKQKQLKDELQQIVQRSPVTHIWKERESSEPKTHILIRGEYDKLGDEVFANTPESLPPMADDWPKNRLGLANWILDESNPLFARVTVNRFWQQIFGNGIVATSEDFGIMGAEPTHPELLDWLAVEFRDQGWDVRKFFKVMLMSSTYRQAALATEEKLFKDPENLLLARGPRFRMDGEMIRDAALQQGGLLSSKMFGPPVKPYQPDNIWDSVGMREANTRIYVEDTGENLFRRSIYTFWKRMAPPPNLEIFNAPNREVCTVKRERTNTPLQALVTLNDITFVEAARNLAQTVLLTELHESGSASHSSYSASQSNQPADIDSERIDAIAERVLSRSMTDAERKILKTDLEFYRTHYQEHLEAAEDLIALGQSETISQIASHELAAWTMICQQVMNLDEAINK